ncbi:hypothetical protein [Janthinobacterium lividum]|uniref:hypothetical protein n=1 Tax=Janthinobacterium lividum TaxID=29581 RepID=UPI00092FFE0A|nr:hypothetical protein [Janthinobacterium lividum]
MANAGTRSEGESKGSANKPQEQSDIAKFFGDLKLGEIGTQFGRRLMADFADNNRGDFGFWAAEKVDNNFERPDESSAEGVVAKVGAVAATLATPGGARAKLAEGAESLSKAAIWSSKRGATSVENVYVHWKKHASEFPEFLNAKQYVDAARNFVANPPGGALIKVKDGNTLIYDAATNTFGSRAASGVPRTMFRPRDGIEYWNKQ